MSIGACAVTVKQLPETIDAKRGRKFRRALESNMDADRPSIVFDCSQMLHLDKPAVLLLLDCLEDAMKRNGDIKLAALHEQARAMLKRTGADRLFEIFDTNADAASSFHRLPLHAATQSFAPFGNSHPTAENAA